MRHCPVSFNMPSHFGSIGLRYLSPAVAGLWLTLVPIFGLFGAYVWLAEVPTPLMLVWAVNHYWRRNHGKDRDLALCFTLGSLTIFDRDTIPMRACRGRRAAETPMTSRPLTWILPSTRAFAGNNPRIASAVSDLPEPDAPRRQTLSPRCTSNDNPSTTICAPIPMRRLRTDKIGSPTAFKRRYHPNTLDQTILLYYNIASCKQIDAAPLPASPSTSSR